MKTTLIVQLAVGAKVAPQLLPCVKSPPLVPVIAMLEIFRVALPVLLMEIVSGGLEVPTRRLLKIRLTGDNVIAGELMPIPVRDTPCGLPTALSVMVIAPVRVPAADGVNVTNMLQLAELARLLPQLLVCEKSPLATIPTKFRGRAALPFVSVTIWALLDEPTGWLAKFKLFAESVKVGELTTVTVDVAVLFSGLGSETEELTMAVFVIVPTVVGVTTMLTAAFTPVAIVPRLQVIVAAPVQLPWLDVTETKVTPAGNLSVSVTPVAGEGPLLLAVSV